MKTYKNFEEFYPYYLSQHTNKHCRRLHFLGTLLVINLSICIFLFTRYDLFWLLPLSGYSFAWIGHFFFEKNKPATFKYPLYSLMGDFKMFYEIVTGKVRI